MEIEEMETKTFKAELKEFKFAKQPWTSISCLFSPQTSHILFHNQIMTPNSWWMLPTDQLN